MPPGALPDISRLVLRFFTRIVRSYFRRHFRAVQVLGAERLANARGPLIVYGNHPSWWDPMLCVLLAQELLPGRDHYAPMDAVPLRRYPFLRKAGIFPVEMGSPRGAVQFLHTAEAILNSGGVLWMTPQGRFADVRERPLDFKKGIAVLVRRVPGVKLVPLAAEYTFWDERLPEALAYIADPIQIDAELDVDAWTQRLERALEQAMDALREAALTRDPLLFRSLLQGQRGTGGVYARIQRLRALFTGKGFRADQSARDIREDGA